MHSLKKYFAPLQTILCCIMLVFVQCNCSKKSSAQSNPVTPAPPPITNISMWVTTADQSILLQQQANLLSLGSPANTNQNILVDSTQTYQTLDGFGFTLTGGSASLINALPTAQKNALLNELFGNAANAIGISYLRISLGASDLNASVFSYDDLPTGQTDISLNNFSLSQDALDLIPVLKQILTINPNIKILASPWSAPVWMKDNGSTIGGSLQSQYYNVYAKYFVKYILAMQANGINIDAITIQNEPQNPGNNPSMVMSAVEEANFIKNSLGPAFQAASLHTKIIVWDHNCDNPTYPLTILNDATANSFVDGSAFHLYAGDIAALSTVHNAYPNKNLYFTEQWTGSTGTFTGDFIWHIKNVIIGSMNNWSKNALEWNLANDGGYNPHTPGGCTQCKGALTLDGNINRNVGYYIIAQASKFIPAGSVRIASSTSGQLSNVAFVTPTGQKVLIVLNDLATAQTFTISFNKKIATTVLPANAVATYVW